MNDLLVVNFQKLCLVTLTLIQDGHHQYTQFKKYVHIIKKYVHIIKKYVHIMTKYVHIMKKYVHIMTKYVHIMTKYVHIKKKYVHIIYLLNIRQLRRSIYLLKGVQYCKCISTKSHVYRLLCYINIYPGLY